MSIRPPSLARVVVLIAVLVFPLETYSEELYDSSETNDPSENGALQASLLGKMAVLQLLNKVSARNSILNIRAGTSERFGNLQIKVKDCWKAPPEEMPEVSALLEVTEEKIGEDRKHVFYGWMFASSPAISALEHPVYDITVLDCKEWTGD